MQTLRRIPFWAAMGLLLYMPLHVFLAQSLSLVTGGLEIWKLAKDLVVFASVMFTICLVWRYRKREVPEVNLLIGLSLAYLGVHLLLWALHMDVYKESALLGITYNCRVFAFLVIGMGAALLWPLKQINQVLVFKVVLGVSTLVAAFGVLQYFLPSDFMTHFGYSPARGVLPAFFIDNRPDFPRIMSTLRDPNSLGAYLILPITLFVGLIPRVATMRRRMVLTGAFVLHLAALFLTFSRGAWIAALLSALVMLVWQYAELAQKFLRRWWPVMAAVFVIGLAGVFVARNTYAFKSVVTHRTGAPQGAEYDSNGFHWVFAKRGLEGIVQAPFGHGPGTAGLASIQNPAGSFLTENYYIQIGYEVGIIGLALFLLLNVWVYVRLWARRTT
ncbi:MAG TPA: O-antigen ligase family protein, partial [Candidatus Saccharimonadales bacterium]|nr:O-antigen ligase family protein [Candidatus Saccharimonadales bacterium]